MTQGYKNMLILALFGGILFLVFFLFFIFGRLQLSKSRPVVVPTPTVTSELIEPSFEPLPTFILQIPTADFLQIDKIAIANFYRQAERIVRNDVLIENNEDYQIVYLGNFKTFVISILATPFDEVKRKAEDEFLKVLKIDSADACKLSVYVSTVERVDPQHAGTRYPLRFCGG